MKTGTCFDETIDSLRGTLLQLRQWGWPGFNCSRESLEIIAGWGEKPEKQHQKERLEDIQTDLGDCRRCPLSRDRTHIVYGEGNSQARLVFVGEGPGYEEDKSGRPFVGPAGQLLDRIIQAMKLDRGQVYICNVIKCRPSENRDPLPEEIKACRPFLERQLSAIGPEMICALGVCATSTLLDTAAPFSTLRGRFFEYAGAKLMPTFHPAYLLKHPDQKKMVWEDMKKIMALLNIPL